MTYKTNGSSKDELADCQEVSSTPIKLNDYNNMSDDSDSIGKDFNDEQNKLDEIVVVENKAFRHNDDDDNMNDQISNNSDSASSNESGFGTVDDELDNENEKKVENDNKKKESVPNVIVYQPLQQKQGLFNEVKSNSSNSSQQSDNISKYPQSIKLPTLQGPRQIIYELNNKNNKSDDIANILQDNSSINSSSSSDDTSHLGCGQSFMRRLNKYYTNCFCYSASSNVRRAPVCCTWLSIFCCCCPLLGCISIYFMNRSKKLKLNQKYAQAEKYSNYAEKLNIASLIFGVIFYAIAVFMITLVIFMCWRNQNHAM